MSARPRFSYPEVADLLRHMDVKSLFLGHSFDDIDEVLQIDGAIREAGFETIVVQRHLGLSNHTFNDVATRALRDQLGRLVSRADAFVLISSDSSLKSLWVHAELEAALNAGRPMILAPLDDAYSRMRSTQPHFAEIERCARQRWPSPPGALAA